MAESNSIEKTKHGEDEEKSKSFVKDRSLDEEKCYAVTESSSEDDEEELRPNAAKEESKALEEEDTNEKGSNHLYATLPSTILDEDYVYAPPSFKGFEEREEWKSGGKWLIYTHGDLQKLDNYWMNLLPLLESGTLIGIKSSTGKDTETGIIMCYTADCEDRNAVKKAADAIRNVDPMYQVIYYKTNGATDSGIYAALGDRFITKYMHTVACSMYERDKHKRWTKIFMESTD